MVTAQKNGLHPIEIKLIDMLEEGGELDVSALGGINPLLDAAVDLGRSPLLPEFIRVVLSDIEKSSLSDKANRVDFICQCLTAVTSDMVIKEVVDVLDAHGSLSEDGDEKCFSRFLALAGNQNIKSLVRAFALEGAFRLALSERRRQLRLLSMLLCIKSNDDSCFLSKAAKILGVAYSYWGEEGLIPILRDLVCIDEVKDEAAFELGMVYLSKGMQDSVRANAELLFANAREWFDLSAKSREQRPDAHAFVSCIDIISAFSNGKSRENLRSNVLKLLDYAFQLDVWHFCQPAPSWLGMKHLQNTCWWMLAVRLDGLVESLDDSSWMEPSVIVEQHILAIYVADRSILSRQSNGVLSIVRPRIESSISHKDWQCSTLKKWLDINVSHEWKAEALVILKNVESLIAARSAPVLMTPISATIDTSILSVIEESRIPSTAKDLVKQAILDSIAVCWDNFPHEAAVIIENCLGCVITHPDYGKNSKGARLFSSVLTWSINFLYNRLEMTKGNDQNIAYLFEREDQVLPHEEELQMDFFRFMSSIFPATGKVEVSNIAGGRADVCFSYGGERIVVEVKRESKDSSFSALGKAYSSQATDYQNVSIRLGILLVLDLTKNRKDGTPHISTLVDTCTVTRPDESIPRKLVIIKVPGRRLRPSDLSKISSL